MTRMTRPSPAMLVALLALFVALGGTGYAAIKVTGKNVKNRSLTGKDVKRNSLGGAEIRESKLAKVPRAGMADRATSAATATTAGSLTPQGSAEYFPASKVSTPGVVKRTKGSADVTLLDKVPFKVIGRCSDDAAKTRSEIVVTSSAAGSVLDGAAVDSLPPYGPTPSAAFGASRRDWTLMAQSGATVVFSSTQVINGLGTDCAFSLNALSHP